MIQHDEETEPYILTREEEERSIGHAIEAQKKHLAWKMADKGLKEEQILAKLASINFGDMLDMEGVLSAANSAKNYLKWQLEQREKDKNEAIAKEAELKSRCTAKYMYNVMAFASKNIYGKELIVHDDNLDLIKTLCFFLSRDSRFETELGYSLDKGLWVRGTVGLGKTYLIKCLEHNELNPIVIRSMIEITNEIKANGEYNLPNNKMLYLDDVGTEEPLVKHYGTNIAFFKNFIESYYLKTQEFNRLIVSTNNNFSGIEEKYGFRVRSRIKDMFNIIDVKGKDMRG